MTLETHIPEQSTAVEKELFDPHKIAVVTATFYPKWSLDGVTLSDQRSLTNDQIMALDEETISTFSPEDSANVSSQIRGNLALQSLRIAKDKGFQVVVVDGRDRDGNANEDFRNAIREIGIEPSNEKAKGMSAGRQQGYKEASELDGAQVIAWIEPEKVSMFENLAEAVRPILAGEADVIVPKRNEQLLKETYPDYQTDYEQKANEVFNSMLRKAGLLTAKGKGNAADLDMWFGPKFFKNTPELLEIFTRKYEAKPKFKKPYYPKEQRYIDIKDKEGKIIGKKPLFTKLGETAYRDKVLPEMWAGALFLPIAGVLQEKVKDENGEEKPKYKVRTVEVQYKHPEIQTLIENDSPAFREKRRIQYNSILTTLYEYLDLTENKSRNGALKKA